MGCVSNWLRNWSTSGEKDFAIPHAIVVKNIQKVGWKLCWKLTSLSDGSTAETAFLTGIIAGLITEKGSEILNDYIGIYSRPAPNVLKIVTYYSFTISHNFHLQYYSFVLSLLFQNYSEKMHSLH